MTRIRLKTRPVAIFGAMLVTALIALMPMRLAIGLFGLGDVGLSARAVSGPVWFARLSEAHVGALDLGDLDAGLSPLHLLLGEARVGLRGVGVQAGAAPIHGAVTVSRHSVGFDDMTATVPVGTVFAPLPVSQVTLDGVSVRFAGGSCASAQGRVKALLTGGIVGLNLAQGMSGSVRCVGGELLVPLSSQAGSETITLHVKGDGRYRAELGVQPTDPQVMQALTSAGFVAGRSGYALSVEGHF